jgi:hypothetical protein
MDGRERRAAVESILRRAAQGEDLVRLTEEMRLILDDYSYESYWDGHYGHAREGVFS